MQHKSRDGETLGHPSLSALAVQREALPGDMGTQVVSALEETGHVPAEVGAMVVLA